MRAEQADRGDGHRLPAAVRPGHDEGALRRVEPHVARHDLLPLQYEERVAQGQELEPRRRRRHLGRVRVEVGREAGRRLEGVEPGEHLEVPGEGARARPERLRQLAQDPLLLLGRHGVRDGELVPELDHRVGLDEERLARLRGVVDDARHGRAGARQHRQHVPLVPDGEVAVAEVRLHLDVGEQRLDLGLERAVEPAGALAGLGEGGARAIRDGPGRLDGALDPVRERRRGRERLGERREARDLAGAREQDLAGAARGARERGALAERERLEHAALRGALEVALHVGDAAERQRQGRLRQAAGLPDPRERLAGVVRRGEGGEGEGPAATRGQPAARREGGEDLRKAELLFRSGRHLAEGTMYPFAGRGARAAGEGGRPRRSTPTRDPDPDPRLRPRPRSAFFPLPPRSGGRGSG